jgi:hypothetical protein
VRRSSPPDEDSFSTDVLAALPPSSELFEPLAAAARVLLAVSG